MKLYHFTSSEHVGGCLKEGITKGFLPLFIEGNISLLPNAQWLTSNSEFTQTWAENSTLPYDRTAFRLKINIPKTSLKQLYKWSDICDGLPLLPDFNTYGDYENWWIFKGRIKPSWIKSVEKKVLCPLCGELMKLKEKTDVGDYYNCISCRFTINVDAYGGQPTLQQIYYPEKLPIPSIYKYVLGIKE
jgi:hypothetical protein